MDYKHKSDVFTLHSRNDDYELRKRYKYIYYIFLNVVIVFLIIILFTLLGNEMLRAFFSQILEIPNIVKAILVISFLLLMVQ